MGRLNLVGQRFGRLLVIEDVGNKHGGSRWRCVCDCGKEAVVGQGDLRRNDKKKTRSCGCLQREISSEYHRNNQFGENNPMYGKSHAEKARRKISESRIGKHFTKETMQKMRDNHSDVSGENNPNYGNGDKIRGENNPNWKGGITPENERIRKSTEMGEWRQKVFERDNYICQICSKKDVCLEAHHIYPFADYHGMRFRIWNGITLCKNCHEKIRGKEYQFIEQFLNTTLERLKNYINRGDV